jgi:hypothetical protein
MALTTAGVNFLAQSITGQGTPFNGSNAHLAVGNGLTAFNASQADLVGGSKYRKKVDAGYPIVEPPTVKFRATFAPDEANFAWTEWGIFNASTGGVMLNRVVESNGTKQSNQSWVLEVAVTFTASV